MSAAGRRGCDGSLAWHYVCNSLIILPCRGFLPSVDLSSDDDILEPEDVGYDGGVPDHQVLRYSPALNPVNNPVISL